MNGSYEPIKMGHFTMTFDRIGVQQLLQNQGMVGVRVFFATLCAT